jgi:rubrerythrin
MSASKSFLHFSLGVVSILVMVLVINGCQKKEGEAAKPQAAQSVQSTSAPATIENLKAAYGLELKCVDWYERFSKQAQKENLSEISMLFKALSKSEKVHADKTAELLKSKGVEVTPPTIEAVAAGKTRQYLKLSVSNENVEASTLAAFQAKAVEEQFPEAAELFRRSMEADSRHGRLLSRAIEMETNFSRLPYMMCPECGYIVGSEKDEECRVCKTPKSKFQKI